VFLRLKWLHSVFIYILHCVPTFFKLSLYFFVQITDPLTAYLHNRYAFDICAFIAFLYVWLSVELSPNLLLGYDDNSDVTVAGAVLGAMQVMSLMLT